MSVLVNQSIGELRLILYLALACNKVRTEACSKEMKARAYQYVSLTNYIIPRHLQSSNDTTSLA